MPDSPRPIYITTPIYYVNDKPHVGHAYTTIVADFLTRALRLLGCEVFFLTGTDEHGAKVAEVARASGMTPQAWCDVHAQHFQDAWKRLDIEYDYFIRTTDDRHVRGVAKLLDRLHAKSGPDGRPVVYEGEYAGLYCLGCEKFITEKELVEGLCPDHLTRPQELREKNYFFRLKAYLGRVEEKIRSGEIRVLPVERRNEVLGLFKQGLENFSISREKVDWGIPLPWDPSQNAYVWVDALPNYITAVGYGDNPATFAHWWTSADTIHLLGKDILKFHAIFWPAMLLAVGEKTPDTIFIHGYFTVNGQKMSKTLGNALDPHALVDQFGPDGTRYLLLTQFQFGQDGDVKAEEFVRQFNADLANDLGNLVSRVVALIGQHFAGQAPPPGTPGPHETVLATHWDRALTYFGTSILATSLEEWAPKVDLQLHDAPEINVAIDAGIQLVRETNRYLELTQPWQVARDGDRARLGTILSTAVEAIRRASIILSPIIPRKAEQILRSLGITEPDKELRVDDLGSTDKHVRALCPGPFHLEGPIFPRLDKIEVAKREKTTVSDTHSEPAAENVITIDEFKKVQLRTAEVVVAERVEGANRLLKLQIAIGDERRQIVAGIAEYYKPEDLVGKTIIVVANLQPATVRGIPSQGMLLAASKGKTLRLVTTDGPIDSGSGIS